jgi:hypothetical protein
VSRKASIRDNNPYVGGRGKPLPMSLGPPQSRLIQEGRHRTRKLPRQEANRTDAFRKHLAGPSNARRYGELSTSVGGKSATTFAIQRRKASA